MESMQPIQKTEQPRFTPESAKVFLERYKNFQETFKEKSKAMEEYRDEILRMYPDFAEPKMESKTGSKMETVETMVAPADEISAPSDQTPDDVVTQEDNEAVISNTAILDTSNTSSAATAIAPVVTVIKNPMTDPVHVFESAATQNTPDKEQAPAEIKNPESEKMAMAKSIADKIKHHPTTMTAADWEFERNKENRKLIDDALMDMANILAIVQEDQLISPGIPTLDRSRDDYTAAMAKNEKKLADGTIESWNETHLKNLQANYDANHVDGYVKAYAEGGPTAAMKFALDEERKRIRGVLENQTDSARERVGKAMSKVAGVGIAAGILAYVAVEKSIQKLSEVDWRKKLENLTKKKDPLTWKGLIGIKSEDQKKKEEQEAKEKEEKKIKAGESKLKKFFGSREKVDSATEKQAKALDETKRIENKKREENVKKVLESIIGEPLEGDRLKQWNNIKEMELGRFMLPEKINWGGNYALGQITVNDYPEYAKKLHEKLRPIYKSYADVGTVNGVSNVTLDKEHLDHFISRLVDRGELKV